MNDEETPITWYRAVWLTVILSMMSAVFVGPPLASAAEPQLFYGVCIPQGDPSVAKTQLAIQRETCEQAA